MTSSQTNPKCIQARRCRKTKPIFPNKINGHAADPLSAGISPRFLIVEQASGLPFNRGALLNVGFRLLAPEVEYICLHDVDRVPIEADYRWPERPLMIIRHGLPLPPHLIEVLLSSVVVMQNQHFEVANGFSNSYWGWGYEDVDLRERLLRRGLVHAHRDGTFRSLPHVDLGSHPDGTPTADARKNQAVFISRWFDRHGERWRRRAEIGDNWLKDGLASLEFSIVSPLRSFPHEASDRARIDKVIVDFPPPQTVHARFLRSLPVGPTRRLSSLAAIGSLLRLAAGTTWKLVFLNETRGQFDLDRVHFIGRVPHQTF